MIIEENDFKLIQCEPSPVFDVEVLSIIRPKGKETRSEFKNIGYGVSIQRALELIIYYKINKKHAEKNIIPFKEYLKSYKEIIDELNNTFNKILNEDKKENCEKTLLQNLRTWNKS